MTAARGGGTVAVKSCTAATGMVVHVVSRQEAGRAERVGCGARFAHVRTTANTVHSPLFEVHPPGHGEQALYWCQF